MNLYDQKTKRSGCLPEPYAIYLAERTLLMPKRQALNAWENNGSEKAVSPHKVSSVKAEPFVRLQKAEICKRMSFNK